MAKESKIGKLRNRLSVQGLTKTPDGFGGFTATWAEVSNDFANVVQMKGKRALEFGEIVEGTPFDITMRLNPEFDMNKELKLVEDGVNDYIIHSVAKDEQRNFIAIVAYQKK